MKIIGHRGAKGLAPENTIASLLKAIEHGVDEVEFDLRVTKDDEVILSHNSELHNASGTGLVVADHTYSELKTHKPDLTTFDEVLDKIGKQVPLLIEVKPHVPTAPIVKTIKKALSDGWSAEDFRIGSFSQSILVELHKQLPDIQKIVIENWSGVRASRRARQVNTKRLSMLELWLWSGFISSMARAGYEIYSFPPKTASKEKFFAKFGLAGHTNNPKLARKWARSGLAGVITDFPDRFEK